MRGRVLIIAGSDSGGGAGVQADLKAVMALGGYAMTTITALTAQNTLGVAAIHAVPAAFVEAQIKTALDDMGADCIKIGMLHRAEIVELVAQTLRREAPGVPIVLDPVMLAKGGHRLIDEAAVARLCRELLPMARLVTPNLPEAALLAGAPGSDPAALGEGVLAHGAAAVLVKGGHAEGEILRDLLVEPGPRHTAFIGSRLSTRHTHGTGCTLASAIATGLAQGYGLGAAVRRARQYLRRTILTAPGYGQGNGPLNHGLNRPLT
jgi:hydroxymethylpyrimidine/phosphomethylpyrimidine kinase